MSPSQKRVALAKLYGPSWAAKVEKMSDAQVSAIYIKKLNEGAFKQ
jgi:hypothetical protein